MGDLESLIWHYKPNLAVCIIALVLFALSTLAHIIQLIKFRQLSFIFFVLGGIAQVVGYIARIGCIHDLNSITFYVIHTLAILLAPIFYAVSIYGLLGKVIQYTEAEGISPIKPTRITCIFVIGDLLSFLMQSTGGGLMTSGDPDKTDLGTNIILIGLIIQLVFFFVFIFLTYIFHIRTQDWNASSSQQGNWKLLLKILEVGSVLIFIRSVYRVIEYGQGFDGYLVSHEAYLYLFDALMMFLVQILFNVVHPGAILQADEKSSNDIEMGMFGILHYVVNYFFSFCEDNKESIWFKTLAKINNLVSRNFFVTIFCLYKFFPKRMFMIKNY